MPTLYKLFGYGRYGKPYQSNIPKITRRLVNRKKSVNLSKTAKTQQEEISKPRVKRVKSPFEYPKNWMRR